MSSDVAQYHHLGEVRITKVLSVVSPAKNVRYQIFFLEREGVLWMFSFPLYWLSVICCSSFESVAEELDT